MEIRIPSCDSDKIMDLLMAISEIYPELTHDLSQLIHSSHNGLVVEILPLTFKRSRQQERYYRKWANEFGKFTGNTPNEIHEYMLYECYGGEIVNTKLGIRPRPNKRSADTTKGDYSDLIETLIRIASEHGFVIPPPIRQQQEWNNEIQ